MKAVLTALGCGLLFGVGLCVSGMTDPSNVIAFLDVSGKWSPNLAGVMLAAVAVHLSWLRWTAARRGETKDSLLPAKGKRIDGALVGGASLFGIGWGMAGYCPGPAVVALASGALGAFVFVIAMAVGMMMSERSKWTIRRSGRPSILAR